MTDVRTRAQWELDEERERREEAEARYCEEYGCPEDESSTKTRSDNSKLEAISILLIIHAIALALYSLPMILAPSAFWSLYGVALSDGAIVVVQLFGGVVLGNTILSWLIRNADDSELRRTIFLVFFVDWAVGFIAALIGQIAGSMNLLGWSTVAIGLFWALVFGYFRFVK